MNELINATLLGDTRAVQILLNKGLDADEKDEEGNTALMFAARFNNASIARVLLSHGANPLLENCQGQTASHLFSEHDVNIDTLCDFSNSGSISKK